MKPKVCVAVPARSQLEATELLKKAEAAGADLAEVRFDYAIEALQPRLLAKATGLPLMATNRPSREGGLFAGGEHERFDILLRAAEAGFSYVDLELSTPCLHTFVDTFKALGVKSVISHHDFASTPPLTELLDIVRRMEAEGASVCKLITTAASTADNLACLELVSKVAERTSVVCFAMGERGLVSRALSPLFGAVWTYASVEEGLETASGQITIMKLRQLYALLGA
ncbi:MAG: type I 3-dehydroquinate dehydratase [Candidatus Bathyarchaeia archaeon]